MTKTLSKDLGSIELLPNGDTMKITSGFILMSYDVKFTKGEIGSVNGAQGPDTEVARKEQLLLSR